MSTPNRFAVRDAGSATFYKLSGNKAAICTLNTLKTTGVTTTGETVYARGGFGNSKIVGFSSNREAKLALTDAIFDKQAIAMLTGNDLTSGAKVIPMNEILSSLSDALTLTKTPSGAITSLYKLNDDGTNGTLYTLGNPGANATEFSISDKTITLNAATADATKFRVYYNCTTDSTASTMKVSSDKFGGTFKVVLDVLVRDEYTKADYAGTLIIPNGKFEDNFELSLSSDADPSVLTLNIEILKDPTSTTMWELVIHDKDLIV